MRDPDEVTGGTSGTPAPPVPEPTDERSARALAALMFKPKLDPERRLPQAPDAPPAPVHGGERPEIPVVYGARAVPELDPTPAAADLAASDLAAVGERSEPGSGAIPARSSHTGASQREPDTARGALPSLARQNARFRRAVLIGGPILLLGVAAGITVIVGLLLG